MAQDIYYGKIVNLLACVVFLLILLMTFFKPYYYWAYSDELAKNRLLFIEVMEQAFMTVMVLFLALSVLLFWLEYKSLRVIRQLLLEYDIPVSWKLIWSIRTHEKDPFTGLKRFATFLKKKEQKLDKFNEYDDNLSEAMQLVTQLSLLLANLYTVTLEKTQADYDYHNGLHKEISDYYKRLKHKQNPNYRDFKLYKKWLRKKIQEVELRLKKVGQKPIDSNGWKQNIQWLNPRKRKRRKLTEKPSNKILFGQPESEIKPQWQIFFIDTVVAEKIPVTLEVAVFKELFRKYRTNIDNATTVLEKINLLLNLSAKERREFATTNVNFPGFHKKRIGTARLFFKVDDMSHKFGVNRQKVLVK